MTGIVHFCVSCHQFHILADNYYVFRVTYGLYVSVDTMLPHLIGYRYWLVRMAWFRFCLCVAWDV